MPPYPGEQLERMFAIELDALKRVLSPVLMNFGACCAEFRRQGFTAEEPYWTLLRTAKEDVIQRCRGELAGEDPDQIGLADFVELYPNRTLQFLCGWPTPRVRYLDCLGRAISKNDRDLALEQIWAAFATEANRYPDEPLPGETRASIVGTLLQESLANAGFSHFAVPSFSAKRWHPRPSWVDAMVGIARHDEIDIVILAETSRPRKYQILPDYSSEPAAEDPHFDKIEISLWAIPKRKIPEFHSAALKINQRFFYYYWRFYSLKGLRRIIDAHVCAAKNMLGV
jgi:hypothetical protein